MAILKLEGLTKTFEGKKGSINALTDINIEIEEGEIFGIIGMSGAGKSTLVRCINLLEKPTSGNVVFDGKELTTLKKKDLERERTRISMIFQQFNLLMQRTALKNVCFPLELAGEKGKGAFGSGGTCRSGGLLSGTAFRRTEAASGDCESAGDGSEGAALRRGDECAGSKDNESDPGTFEGYQPQARDYHYHYYA